MGLKYTHRYGKKLKGKPFLSFSDRGFFLFISAAYLTDDVPHLLSVDDVRGVDDGCVAGSVHFGGLFVLGLTSRNCQ